MKVITILLSGFFLITSSILSQNLSLYGKVVDKNNKQPIKDANIYIANTQIGTTTNSNGYFEITNLPKGTFTIVFSHVAYHFITKEIKFDTKFIDIGIIQLIPKAHELETVLITEEEDNTWQDQYDFFRKNFIGNGINSDSTTIENKYKIDFFENGDTLFASAIEPIKILNKALGYEIEYFLDYFEATDKYTKYSGHSVFHQLSSSDYSNSIKWKENRDETYLGSFRHFLNTLNKGFTILNNEIELLNNSSVDSVSVTTSFPYTRFARTKASYHYRIDSLSKVSDLLMNKEGFFIYSVKKLPWETPFIYPEIPISTESIVFPTLLKTENYLSFPNYLRVYYLSHVEDYSNLTNYSIKHLPNIEASYIKLTKDSVMVDIHGRYYDKFGIHTFGQFGRERISDMLPYEYEYSPANNNQK